MKKQIYITSNHTPLQLAYFAGIIDGDGSIYIASYYKRKKTGHKSYHANIEITNSNKDLINWVIKTFGGKSYISKLRNNLRNTEIIVHKWICNGPAVNYICESINPYLIVRLKQAEIMLKMRQTYRGSGKGESKALPDEIYDLRDKYHIEMQSLNQKKNTEQT